MKNKGLDLNPVYKSFLAMALFTWGCSQQFSTNVDGPKVTRTFFQLLDSTHTKITFRNSVKDRDDFNILTYRNFYNGGGVAIGDINNDGLSDIYLTANLEQNKLYLNRGDFTFEDITASATVAGQRAWSTGVTMADVNADGWLDIYVSNSGDIQGDNKENELFINNGDLTFSEKAAEFGLNNEGYSTQAAFFDYDADGDLDCYLLNNSFKDPSKIELFRSMRDQPDPLAGDKLFRNDDGRFTDVTLEAGIYSSVIGFGLGAVIGDINQDHLPDIYISNDFWERDYLYINLGDGTFQEDLINRIDFCSISSMGGDLGDINNDGVPEIISTDMLAADNYRLKAMSAFDPYHLEDIKYRANYHYQIGQNCLHLNDGNGHFQEIAMLSGVGATDWSWGASFFDFENDGWKDLFVSNGLQRDLMYMDFRDFLVGNDIYQKIARDETLDIDPLVAKMPSKPLRNYAFKNLSGLRFSNESIELGLATPSFSNGAAYADLDNDGDHDLVVNNVNMPAFIYRNEAEKTQNNYLKIKFIGPVKNPFGIGAAVKIRTDQGIQTLQNFNTRGFQSSVEPHLIFGLGNEATVSEMTIHWPDQKSQVIENVKANQVVTVNYAEAQLIEAEEMAENPLFREVTKSALQGDIQHIENRYNDFDHEGLLLQMLSTEGPAIVKGDANGDGREDFILLGAHNDADKLFFQTASGGFTQQSSASFDAAKAFESTCGTFLDFDGDGDQDVLIGSGGNQYQGGNQLFVLRYYENDGQGNFKMDISQKIPQVIGNFSTLEASDIDADGDADLFIGARTIPGNYGLPPRNYLFKNSNGVWEDVTPDELAGVGMVTDAIWSDVDGDRDNDLVVVGDWMGIHVFTNIAGTLSGAGPIPNSAGWWRSIAAGDFDEDGDPDFVVGNWGENCKLTATQQRPLTMFTNDYDQNRKTEFIVNWYAPLDDKPYPFATKNELTKQLPYLRKQSLKHEDYAKQTYETLFPAEVREQSFAFEVTTLSSSILWNDSSSWKLSPLPIEAQITPIFAILVEDLTDDGRLDIWLGGNFYNLKPQVGRHAAGRGLLLKGLVGGDFEAVSARDSGFNIKGEIRDAKMFNIAGKKSLLVARNNADLMLFESTETYNN